VDRERRVVKMMGGGEVEGKLKKASCGL